MTDDLAKWIYASGIVDGEGFVSVVKTKPEKLAISPRFRAILTVTNTNKDLINWLMENFGGRFGTKRIHQNNVKPCFTWIISDRKLYPFLKGIYPYLIVKKRLAEITLNFLEGKTYRRGRRGVGSNEIAFRDQCYLDAKSLNHRGVPTETKREGVGQEESNDVIVRAARKLAEVAEMTTRQLSFISEDLGWS